MRKEVDYIFCNESEEWVHVTVNGEEITCTPNHPFYSPVNGWTSAIDLCAGDILVMLNGEYVVVEQVQHELLESPVKVYNFEVEDFHTYYVSETKVLVHNDCDGTNKSTKVIAEHLGYSKVKGVQSLGKAVYYNPKASLDMRYIIGSTQLAKDSIALLEHIRTIDKRRLSDYIGKATAEEMKQIEDALLVSVGMDGRYEYAI